MRGAWGLVVVLSSGAAALGCALVTSFDGFSSGHPASDAGVDVVPAPAADAQPDAEELISPRLWVFGGSTPAAPSDSTSDVMYAPIQPDGSLGTWTSAPAMPRPVRYAPAVVGEGFVTLVGGEERGGQRSSDALIGTIDKGMVSSWAVVPLGTTPRTRHGAFIHQGEVMLVAGVSNDPLDEIQAAPIGPTSIGTWRSVGRLPFARGRAAVVASEQALYVLGGDNAAGDPQTECYRGNFDATRGVPSFVVDQRIAERRHAGALIYQGNLILLAGEGTREVLVFRINADGSLAEPRTSVPLPTARVLFGRAIHAGRLYVVGGIGPDNHTAEVLVADLSDDGMVVGAWRPATPLPVARAYHGAAVF